MRQLTMMGILLLLFVLGCEDQTSSNPTTSDLVAGMMQTSEIPTSGVDDTPIMPIAGDRPEAGFSDPSLEGGMPTEVCGFEQPCPEGLQCFNGRCVEEELCMNGACPQGYLCVGGLCFEDPNVQPMGEGSLLFEPDRMRFVFQTVGMPMQQMAQLVNRGDTPLTLTDLHIEGSSTFMLLNEPIFPVRLSPNAPMMIEVQYTANDELSDSAQVIAETEEGIQTLLSLVGETKSAQPAAPCLEVSPPQIFFGSVGRGQTVTRDVTLRNCNEQLVTVTAVTRGRSFFGELPQTFTFSAPSLPLQLEAGDVVTFPVQYAPRRAGLEGGFIEVHSNDATQATQRVDLSAIAEPPALQDVGLHVKLAWDTDYTDIDLHLLGPGGQLWTCEGDCYFSNRNPNWGDQNTDLDDPFLDLDDVDGYGPENINLEAPIAGTYKVLVHFWDPHEGSDARATIELYQYGTLMGSYGPEPLTRVNEVWEVAEIDFPGFVIRPIHVTMSQNRGSLCGGF